jgi:hypothetical protein
MRPEDYRQIPENRHSIAAGSILLPTDSAITVTGASSRDFVAQQGGDESTFIFIFGIREARGALGATVEFLEGVFLSESGQGFHPTWDLEQLLREVDLGGWKVVTTGQMLDGWVAKVEARMNLGEDEG